MPEPDLDVEAWRERLRRHRDAKDEYLRTDPDSPLAARDGFESLDYYPPDPEFRRVARYEPRQSPETVSLALARGPGRPDIETGAVPSAEYEAVATFGFDIAGSFTTLTGFRAEGQETVLVPFTDETTADPSVEPGQTTTDPSVEPGQTTTDPSAEPGQTMADATPAIGRYLDVDVSAVDARDDVALDFNFAYAPFAHYDDAFASPVPPAENHVDARVEAGERTLF